MTFSMFFLYVSPLVYLFVSLLVFVHMSICLTNLRPATSARLRGHLSAAVGKAALINTTMSAPKR